MNKEEIRTTWLYNHELDNESLKIKNYIETLETQLDQANKKIEKIKCYLNNNDDEILDNLSNKQKERLYSIIGAE